MCIRDRYSLYQANRSFLSSEQVITFTDLDGRLLALKPDVTLSIAKTAQQMCIRDSSSSGCASPAPWRSSPKCC